MHWCPHTKSTIAIKCNQILWSQNWKVVLFIDWFGFSIIIDQWPCNHTVHNYKLFNERVLRNDQANDEKSSFIQHEHIQKWYTHQYVSTMITMTGNDLWVCLLHFWHNKSCISSVYIILSWFYNLFLMKCYKFHHAFNVVYMFGESTNQQSSHIVCQIVKIIMSKNTPNKSKSKWKKNISCNRWNKNIHKTNQQIYRWQLFLVFFFLANDYRVFNYCVRNTAVTVKRLINKHRKFKWLNQ